MPLRPDDVLEYRGHIQPERWKLHPDDFRARITWEADRQRILDAQAHSIEQKLPYPKERIPPIPELLYPEYVDNPVDTSTKSVDKKGSVDKVVDIPVDRVVEPVDEVEDATARRKRQQREWARKKRERGTE